MNPYNYGALNVFQDLRSARCRTFLSDSQVYTPRTLECSKKTKARSTRAFTVEMAPQVRLELTTLRLTAECSAIELLRNMALINNSDNSENLQSRLSRIPT